MGRPPEGDGGIGTGLLFPESEIFSVEPEDNLPLDTPALKYALLNAAPPQSDAKARLISEYLARFQLVTKGGLYIDGFAGPQKLEHPGAWTARRVLGISPPRLRTFWLCEMEPVSIGYVEQLAREHNRVPRSRRVFVFRGDFNETYRNILLSGRIKRRSAVFALLDQRTDECKWATVQALAAFKGRTRIELLYFLGTGWLHRSMKTASRPEKLASLDAWWGDGSWREMKDVSQTNLSSVMSRRFARELGYRHVNWWPIYLQDEGQKVAFTLIHATDHDAAPLLMRRAYVAIYGRRPGSPVDGQIGMGF